VLENNSSDDSSNLTPSNEENVSEIENSDA